MSADEVTPETEPERTWPDPSQRKRVPNPQGIPLRLGDGKVWMLAHGCLSPLLLGLTDEIFDRIALTSTIPIGPCLTAAWKLLVANYNLSDDEVQALLDGAKDEDLVNAATDALIGPQVRRKTWSTWALSSLYANGIEPSSVPPWLIPDVLHQLVQTGRAMGQTDFIDSVNAAHQRAELFARLPKQGEPRKHPAPPSSIVPPAPE